MTKKKDLLDLPNELVRDKHGGHSIRTGRKVIDRGKIDEIPVQTCFSEKKIPNSFLGPTYKNKISKYNLDGHKMIYHLERILDWKNERRIAPIHIDMGITKFCNIACNFCYGVTQGMKKGSMIMPDKLLQFIIDAKQVGVKSLGFIGDGEPTLNPGLYDAIKLASEVGIDTGMATNGQLLDINEAGNYLKNMKFIRFTLCAADPEAFLKIHQSHKSNFQPLIDKIVQLVKIKKENNYKCTLGLQMVLVPENFDQIVKMAKLGQELGVDYLQLKQCADTEYKEIGIDYHDYLKIQTELKEAESYTDKDYTVIAKWNKLNITQETKVYKDGIRKYDVCFGTPFLGQISGNGEVYPCGPFFGKKRFFMGDINKESYANIVMSDKYWQVQKDIVKSVDVHCDCNIGCRQDYINKFLWDLENPPEHINFI